MTPASLEATRAQPPGGLLDALRARTHDLHTRAERHAIQAALVKGSATAAAYAAYLAQLMHIHALLEAELASRASDPLLAPIEPGQFRESKAREDLAELGLGAPAEPLEPVVRFGVRVPAAASAELLGMHYVLEGSTNGGRFIARAVGRGPGLAPGAATRYLDPYGDDQKQRWGAFCGAISSLPLGPADAELVLSGAEEMFRLIIDTFDAMTARAESPSARA